MNTKQIATIGIVALFAIASIAGLATVSSAVIMSGSGGGGGSGTSPGCPIVATAQNPNPCGPTLTCILTGKVLSCQ